MNEIRVKAEIDQVSYVCQTIDKILEAAQCPTKAQIAVDIAIDEILSNICYYAYKEESGEAIILVDIHENPKAVSLCFVDSGTPYNPLEKPDPDISLSADERPIGGLGIFMVKKSMDKVNYEYKDGQNRFTIYKIFDQ